MKKLPFNDLHGFKDYVTFVGMCAPDKFPIRENFPQDEQWTMDFAFDGLRYGIDIAEKEKGASPKYDLCRKLIEEAYDYYKTGQMREGYFKIREVAAILKKIPSW